MITNKSLPLLALVSLVAGAGCTHTAQITKHPTPAPVAETDRPAVALGFQPVLNNRLLDAAIQRVQADPSVLRSQENWKPSSDFTADYVCGLAMTNRYKASGQNFLITFPGFIVFTHAWLGYKYTATLETECSIYDGRQNLISQNTIVTPFEFRHCSFGRGAAAAICGWVLPGYGAAAVIPGIVAAASYDKSATSPFLEKAEAPYAAYVSNEILRFIREAHTNATPSTTTSILQLPAHSVAEGPPGSSSEYTEDHYAVYVIRTDAAPGTDPEFAVTELSASARDTLDFMSATGMMAEDAAMEGLLTEFGLSSGEVFGQTAEMQVFTQRDENVQVLSPLSGPATEAY